MKNLITIAISLVCISLYGQLDTIHFSNPSFIGQPTEGYKKLPKGWVDCGFKGETPPDVHPVLGGNFSVTKEPENNKTKQEGEIVLDQLIDLLLKNRKIGVDFGIKKYRGLGKWRAEFLNEKLLARGVRLKQYDVDKFSNFEKGEWEINTRIMAINIYKLQ